MTAPMCAEHAMPVIECENVRLTRSRRAPVCMCSHPKAVHQHYRPGLDCGKCDCRSYESARRLRLARIEPGRQFGIVVTLGCLGWVAFLAWLFLGHVRP